MAQQNREAVIRITTTGTRQTLSDLSLIATNLRDLQSLLARPVNINASAELAQARQNVKSLQKQLETFDSGKAQAELDALANRLASLRDPVSLGVDTSALTRLQSTIDSINSGTSGADALSGLRKELDGLQSVTFKAEVQNPADVRKKLEAIGKDVTISPEVRVQQLDALSARVQELRRERIDLLVNVDSTALRAVQAEIQRLEATPVTVANRNQVTGQLGRARQQEQLLQSRMANSVANDSSIGAYDKLAGQLGSARTQAEALSGSLATAGGQTGMAGIVAQAGRLLPVIGQIAAAGAAIASVFQAVAAGIMRTEQLQRSAVQGAATMSNFLQIDGKTGVANLEALTEKYKELQKTIDLRTQNISGVTSETVQGITNALAQSTAQLAGQTGGQDLFKEVLPDLAESIASAANLTQIPADELAMEVRQLVGGDFGGDSRLAMQFGFDKQQFERMKEQGKLAEYIKQQLSGATDANKLLNKTLDQSFSVIQDTVQTAQADVFGPFLEPLQTGFKAFADGFRSIFYDDKGQASAFLTGLTESMQGIADAISASLPIAQELFGKIGEGFEPLLPLLGEIGQSLGEGLAGGIQLLVGGISSLADLFVSLEDASASFFFGFDSAAAKSASTAESLLVSLREIRKTMAFATGQYDDAEEITKIAQNQSQQLSQNLAKSNQQAFANSDKSEGSAILAQNRAALEAQIKSNKQSTKAVDFDADLAGKIEAETAALESQLKRLQEEAKAKGYSLEIPTELTIKVQQSEIDRAADKALAEAQAVLEAKDLRIEAQLSEGLITVDEAESQKAQNAVEQARAVLDNLIAKKKEDFEIDKARAALEQAEAAKTALAWTQAYEKIKDSAEELDLRLQQSEQNRRAQILALRQQGLEGKDLVPAEVNNSLDSVAQRIANVKSELASLKQLAGQGSASQQSDVRAQVKQKQLELQTLLNDKTEAELEANERLADVQKQRVEQARQLLASQNDLVVQALQNESQLLQKNFELEQARANLASTLANARLQELGILQSQAEEAQKLFDLLASGQATQAQRAVAQRQLGELGFSSRGQAEASSLAAFAQAQASELAQLQATQEAERAQFEAQQQQAELQASIAQLQLDSQLQQLTLADAQLTEQQRTTAAVEALPEAIAKASKLVAEKPGAPLAQQGGATQSPQQAQPEVAIASPSTEAEAELEANKVKSLEEQKRLLGEAEALRSKTADIEREALEAKQKAEQQSLANQQSMERRQRELERASAGKSAGGAEQSQGDTVAASRTTTFAEGPVPLEVQKARAELEQLRADVSAQGGVVQGGRVQFAEGQKSKEFGLQAKFDELAGIIEKFNSKADVAFRNDFSARGVGTAVFVDAAKEAQQARATTANAAAGQASQAQAQRQQGGASISEQDIKAIRQSLESQLPGLKQALGTAGATEVNITNKVDPLNRSALRAQGII